MIRRVHSLALLACFAVSATAAGCSRTEELEQKSQDATTGQVEAVVDGAETAKYILESGLVSSLHAKEMCSCLYVSKMPEAECKDQVRIPVDVEALNRALDRLHIRRVLSSEDLVETSAPDGKSITARAKVPAIVSRLLNLRGDVSSETTATFDAAHSEYGCRITKKVGVLR